MIQLEGQKKGEIKSINKTKHSENLKNARSKLHFKDK